MDRDAIARERRLAEAREALQFEREREAALAEQLADVVLEQERARIDEEALSRLSEGDAALVREALGAGGADEDDEELEVDDEWADFLDLGDDPAVDEDEDGVDEIGRLQAEIEGSRARQRALEAFVEALADPAPAATADADSAV